MMGTTNEDRRKVKALLTEAIVVLCKSGLKYNVDFCVEGLLGITVDSEDCFLVNIKETVQALCEETQQKHCGNARSGKRTRGQLCNISPEPNAKVQKADMTAADSPLENVAGDSSHSESLAEDHLRNTFQMSHWETPGTIVGSVSANVESSVMDTVSSHTSELPQELRLHSRDFAVTVKKEVEEDNSPIILNTVASSDGGNSQEWSPDTPRVGIGCSPPPTAEVLGAPSPSAKREMPHCVELSKDEGLLQDQTMFPTSWPVSPRKARSAKQQPSSKKKPVQNPSIQPISKIMHFCTECSFSSPYRSTLVRHSKLKHLGFKACSLCGQAFANMEELTEHKVKHKADPKKRRKPKTNPSVLSDEQLQYGYTNSMLYHSNRQYEVLQYEPPEGSG